MNVGIVTTWMQRGATFVSLAYIEALSHQHNVFVFARGGEKYDGSVSTKHLNKVHFSRPGLFDLSGTPIRKREFVRWIQTNKINTIIFNEQQSWEPIMWCKKMKVKTVSYVDYYTKVTVSFFSLYDVVICNTKKHYSVFQGLSQCYYVPWGTKIPSKKALSDSFTRELVFSLGHNPYRKGFDFFLEAMERDMLCLNDFSIGVYTQRPLNLTEKHKLTLKALGPRLKIFVGDFSTEEIFKTRAIYMYLSRLDGIGLSLPEAVAYGMVPIISNCEPMNEFVDSSFSGFVEVESFVDRADGYYFPECSLNVQSLIEIIRHTTSLTAEELLARSDTAYFYATQKLNWNKNSRLLNNILGDTSILTDYESILNRVVLYERNRKRGLTIKQKVYFVKRNFNKIVGLFTF